MKKLLPISILLSTLLYGEAQIYVGLLGGYTNEGITRNSTSETVSSPTAKLQIGYGDLKDYSVQFGVLYNKNDRNIFADAGQKDKEKYSLDVELIKAFDFNLGIYPFLKVGFGAGTFDTSATYTNIDGTFQAKSLNFSSYNAGAGVYYPLDSHFTLEAGATYQRISYEKIDPASTQKAPTANAILSYAGVNYRF